MRGVPDRFMTVDRAWRGSAIIQRFPMLLFWLLASLLILAALLLVVPPLMRGGATAPDAPGDANVALYRERLAELDRERDRSEVDADRYAALREDLERGLLADVGRREAVRTATLPPPYWMAITVAVVVPVGSLAFYLWLGSPHGLDPRASPRDAAAGIEPASSVEAMVDSLAAKLASDPADADGWLLLARSQVLLERFAAAIVGFERAHALLGDEPSLLADWAEAETAVAGNRFPTSALGRLDRALELDPGHEKALWLGGFAAAQNGRMDLAIARWERLLARQPPGSREESIVTELLAQLRGTEGTPPAARSEAAEASASTESAGGSKSEDGARIVVEISLATDLAVELGASEPVFVFARAPAGAGPPVAVARTIVGVLPTTVVLDESNAMVPSKSLASVERAVVTARVARSGTANRSSGDIEGVSGPVTVADSAPVRIVLSQIVP